MSSKPLSRSLPHRGFFDPPHARTEIFYNVQCALYKLIGIFEVTSSDGFGLGVFRARNRGSNKLKIPRGVFCEFPG